LYEIVKTYVATCRTKPIKQAECDKVKQTAIDLLKTFMEIPADLTADNSSMFLWKVTIHMAFVVSGVLFAVMDRISAETKSH